MLMSEQDTETCVGVECSGPLRDCGDEVDAHSEDGLEARQELQEQFRMG